ncbi:hypothetical protein [Clostridium sp. CMCC3677]|uniref:hypothetical protein n=1 Tax=Clostridium sp. CMCC3677 TaxID=2949963 RepID=UPI0013F01317|nr:hypothetical protein [Clostridium sp. CMCC3677]NFG61351.1 hypothetical protein [Clostridium botulinum]NFQ09178.1 hypothetical protein [Clostridium botulinum]
MEWLNCETKEKILKEKYGSLDKLRKAIKKDCRQLLLQYNSSDKNVIEMFRITSGSWKGIIDKISIFKEVIKKLNMDVNKVEKDEREESSETFFKSEQARLIFYLLEIDGVKRAKALNITKTQYSNKKLAKKWRDNIAKKIHPDICNVKGANKAISKLNQLYEEMTAYE